MSKEVKTALIGAIATIIAAVISGVFLLRSISSQPPPSPTPPLEAPTSTPAVCFISGAVFNKDDNQPLPNVKVGYLRFTQNQSDYIILATAGPDGHFEADCSRVEQENFPFRLTVVGVPACPGSIFDTDVYIHKGERRSGINIFISVRFLASICPTPTSTT